MKPSLLKITPQVAGDRLVFSQSWITNGHWAIKRELVFNGKHLNADNASVFFGCCRTTDMEDDQIKKSLPCDPILDEKYEMSPMFIHYSYMMRVFIAESGKYVFINEPFRKLMDLEALYRSKVNEYLFFNEDCSKALMGLRVSSIIEDPRYSRVKEVLDLLNKEVSA